MKIDGSVTLGRLPGYARQTFALRLITGSAVLAFMALLSLGSPAHATFPGRNGEIAYLDIWGSDVEIATDLYRVCASGRHERQFLSGGVWDMGSTLFSPNGRWVAASGHIDYNADPHISVGAVTGQRVRRVSRPPRRAQDGGPSWSPKGGALVFTRARYDIDYALRSVAVRIYRHGRGRFLAHGFNPAWSARDQIAFVRGDYNEDSSTYQLYVVSARGGRPRWLGAGAEPDWSPDGRRLVFSYRVPGVIEGPIYGPASEIATIRADGTGLRRLVSGAGPTWSPDGRRIAFYDQAGYAAVISPSGRGLRRLGRANDYPVFSPDSRWLATTWRNDLYVVRVRDGRRRYVTSPRSGEDLSLLDWRAAPASETRC